jgi:hypothetical protein
VNRRAELREALGTYVGIFFDAWPIFHAHGEGRSIELEDGWRRWEFRTRCGILLDGSEYLDRVEPGPDGRMVYSSERRAEQKRGSSTLPIDHADTIGRPCRRCFR